MAGYEDLNDAERLAVDPAFRLISSQRIRDRGAALTSTLHWFETKLLTREENLVELMALNRDTVCYHPLFLFNRHVDCIIFIFSKLENSAKGRKTAQAHPPGDLQASRQRNGEAAPATYEGESVDAAATSCSSAARR